LIVSLKNFFTFREHAKKENDQKTKDFLDEHKKLFDSLQDERKKLGKSDATRPVLRVAVTNPEESGVNIYDIITGRPLNHVSVSGSLRMVALPQHRAACHRGKIVFIWDTTTLQKLYAFELDAPIRTIAVLPGGKLLTGTDEEKDGLKIWDMGILNRGSIPTNKVEYKFDDRPLEISAAIDGSGIVALHHPESKDEKTEQKPQVHFYEVSGYNTGLTKSLDIHLEHLTPLPDGRLCGVPNEDRNSIHVYDTSTWEISVTLKGHTGPVNCLQALPNNRFGLASGSSDRSVRIWDLESGDCSIIFPRAHAGSVQTLCLLGRDQIGSAGTDAVVRAWNLTEKKCFGSIITTKSLDGYGLLPLDLTDKILLPKPKKTKEDKNICRGCDLWCF